jgi:hypothetical protein
MTMRRLMVIIWMSMLISSVAVASEKSNSFMCWSGPPT